LNARQTKIRTALLPIANIYPEIDGNEMLLGEVARVQHVRRANPN
jgi:hypothetical protein